MILALLAMLYFSYRQTIAAYPVNGGSYTVAKENLGTWASLLAAAALMIDYVLTVAVGISAGVAALVSAAPQPAPLHAAAVPRRAGGHHAGEPARHRRGGGRLRPAHLPLHRQHGVVLVLGIVKAVSAGGHPTPLVPPPALPVGDGSGVSVWLLLRSFASGCTAMTGVEAVSNGVSAFKEPTVKNAHRTLTLIVLILAAAARRDRVPGPRLPGRGDGSGEARLPERALAIDRGGGRAGLVLQA